MPSAASIQTIHVTNSTMKHTHTQHRQTDIRRQTYIHSTDRHTQTDTDRHSHTHAVECIH